VNENGGPEQLHRPGHEKGERGRWQRSGKLYRGGKLENVITELMGKKGRQMSRWSPRRSIQPRGSSRKKEIQIRVTGISITTRGGKKKRIKSGTIYDQGFGEGTEFSSRGEDGKKACTGGRETL